MFPKKISPENLNSLTKNTILSHIGIEFIEIKNNTIIAKMPVNQYTSQPAGILHGGASVTLAESIGSIGSHMLINSELESAVGLEVNANHLRSISSGFVFGIGSIVHKGRSTHVWSIRIVDENDRLISVSRLTVMIIKKAKKK